MSSHLKTVINTNQNLTEYYYLNRVLLPLSLWKDLLKKEKFMEKKIKNYEILKQNKERNTKKQQC